MDRSIILLQAVEVVKSFGYKCFFPRYYTLQKQPTYCYITDGVNIGYMQANEFGYGICFSTIHKPNKRHGNGFGIANNVPLDKITKELIERTIENKNSKAKVEKYTSWEDYTKNSLTGKICEEIVEL
jgi:hypothetical protein